MICSVVVCKGSTEFGGCLGSAVGGLEWLLGCGFVVVSGCSSRLQSGFAKIDRGRFAFNESGSQVFR